MDATVVLFAFNVVLSIAAYLLKRAYEDLKSDNKDLWQQITLIKDKYFKKEDFLEFKKELFARLDRMEDDMKQQISEIKR